MTTAKIIELLKGAGIEYIKPKVQSYNTKIRLSETDRCKFNRYYRYRGGYYIPMRDQYPVSKTDNN